MPATTPAQTSAPATTQAPPAQSGGSRSPRQPEKKIGPFAGGVGVAIWLNEGQMQDGTIRSFRSITLNPRRFFDAKSQQWKDAPSYNPSDLPCLIFALSQAQAYCYETPLPGQTEGTNGENEAGGEPPF